MKLKNNLLTEKKEDQYTKVHFLKIDYFYKRIISDKKKVWPKKIV